MAKKKSRYDDDVELNYSTAFLMAANMYLDAADIAYKDADSATLMDVADRFTKLGSLLSGVEVYFGSLAADGADVEKVGSDGEDSSADSPTDGKVKIGFVSNV